MVEGTGLENRQARKRLEGSKSLPIRHQYDYVIVVFGFYLTRTRCPHTCPHNEMAQE